MKEIGLYIHIPFCKKKCSYCDFNSFEGKESEWQNYIESLIRELHIYQCRNEYLYRTVFIGGGTPTLIHYEQIGRILNKIKPHIMHQAEISIECNPGTVTEESLKYYKEAGINRVSIGLQAWQDTLLEQIGRIHNLEDFLHTYSLCRSIGFKNINVDLMFALPGQTEAMWEETLKNIADLGVEHISCYSLKLEAGTPMYESFQEGKIRLPDDEEDRRMYHKAEEFLKNKGYVQYEISNFAKPGFECRHNLIYWNNQEYLGIGAGSHSKLGDERFWNFESLNRYIAVLKADKLPVEGKEIIDKKEDMWESIFLALRLNKGLSVLEFKNRYGIDFMELYNDKVQKLRSKGLIYIENEHVKLTDLGRDLSNLVFLEFMDK